MMMRTMGDWDLLQDYAKNRSESAFAELVRLHAGWVHAVASRQVNDAHLAQDVTQAVFVLLARKAGGLKSGTLLGGWLFRTTLHVAAHARRTEQRRTNRETKASAMIYDLNPQEEQAWEQLAPCLEQAVAALSESDRAAILLRFYEKRPMREIGGQLGVSEEAAKKRIARALEKMRDFLTRRGIKLGGAALAMILAEKTAPSASAALIEATIKASLTGGMAPAMLPRLAQETLRAWRRAKIQLGAGLVAGSVAMGFVGANAGRWFHWGGSAPNIVVAEAVTNTNKKPARIDPLSAPRAVKGSRIARKTGKITGIVLNELGVPVANAKVWTGFGSYPTAKDTTDSGGSFALRELGIYNSVTVEADGYATDQQLVAPTNMSEPMRFQLSPAQPFLVRVVDEAGHPLPGADVAVQSWWGTIDSLEFRQPTGDDGHLQWSSAPKGEMAIHVLKSGYRSSRTNRITADGLEHVIVLHPAATLLGNVTDAVTGQPINSFRYTVGQDQMFGGPNWNLHSSAGTNGHYQITYDEEPAPWLRIEADNYEMAEAKIEMTNETNGGRDFLLQPKAASSGIRGTVLLPDGSPAAGMAVALCTEQTGVWLRGTGFSSNLIGNGKQNLADYRRTTDESGKFSFDPIPGAHTVVAAGSAGIGSTHCLDHAGPLTIRLQAWGRIEGNVRTHDGRWANRTVRWDGLHHLTTWSSLEYDIDSYSTKTDANGAFTLENIPPGAGRMMISEGDGKSHIISSPTPEIISGLVEVRPGETAEVQIGGTGRTVTGKLIPPPGVEIRNWPLQAEEFTKLFTANSFTYPIPKDLNGEAREKWKLEYADTDAGRTWLQSQYAYPVEIAADGTFTIPEVLPGKYTMFITVVQGYLGSGADTTVPFNPTSTKQIAFNRAEVTVPESPSDGSPLNIGNITLYGAQ